MSQENSKREMQKQNRHYEKMDIIHPRAHSPTGRYHIWSWGHSWMRRLIIHRAVLEQLDDFLLFSYDQHDLTIERSPPNALLFDDVRAPCHGGLGRRQGQVSDCLVGAQPANKSGKMRRTANRVAIHADVSVCSKHVVRLFRVRLPQKEDTSSG